MSLEAARTVPTWSRRPFVGALPKVLTSPLPAAEALDGLRKMLETSQAEGDVSGGTAWIRPGRWPRPPATTLWLSVEDHDGGARIHCRYETSRLDELDIWIYASAAAIGSVVAGSWLSGRMPLAARTTISGAAPWAMAGLAGVALAHYAFRRWRQTIRDRVFDQAMIALGVPIL